VAIRSKHVDSFVNSTLTSKEHPLQWPEGLRQPKKIVRVFYGMPLIGPDIRAYRRFRRQVAHRSPECLREWDDQNVGQACRNAIFDVLVEDMEWPKPLFLPSDPCSILFYDPTIDVKLGVALSKVESMVGRTINSAELGQMLLGDLVKMADQQSVKGS